MVSRWDLLKSSLLDASNKVCGTTKVPPRKKTSWWWNDTVEKAILEKRKCCRAWRNGGPKEDYLAAKRIARREVYEAKKVINEVNDTANPNGIFNLAR